MRTVTVRLSGKAKQVFGYLRCLAKFGGQATLGDIAKWGQARR